MYEFTGAVDVEIRLNNGIYLLDAESAVGKTYLIRLSEQLQLPDFIAWRKISDIDFSKIPVDTRVLVLDRVDMYVRDLDVNTLLALGEWMIVLMDLKSSKPLNINTKACVFTAEMDKVVIW